MRVSMQSFGHSLNNYTLFVLSRMRLGEARHALSITFRALKPFQISTLSCSFAHTASAHHTVSDGARTEYSASSLGTVLMRWRTIVVLSLCFTIRFTGLSTNLRTFVAYMIANVITKQKHGLKLVPFPTSLTMMVSTSPCQT
jgi:hypothetical protein